MSRTILWLATLAIACGLNLHPTPVQAAAKKKLVLIAGTPSHGPGDHEFNAGCLLLKKCLQNVPDLEVVTHLNGWPKDESIFQGADGIFIYSDGGGGHPAVKPERLKLLGEFMNKGVGLGCAHYAVEVPKDKGGPEFLTWIGGYFETYLSVNPHWTADFKSLPKHEVTRGVKPFGIRDEWYYHMRFRPNMEGVTPILTAVPPDSTRGKEGAREPHGGNPEVFARKGMPEHVMWTYERPDGGRGFGFTGGHYHANWGNEDFRKVVLNALLWICKMEVPANGVVSTVAPADLAENLDPKGGKAPRAQAPVSSAKAKFRSGLVKGSAVPVDVDITGAKGLWLVVSDGGDGFGCDWADWAEPRLAKRDGTETKLTDIKWKSATSGHRQANVNKNVGDEALRMAGKPVSYGIGTHAPSVIEYDIAGQDFVRFKATAGLDNGGTDQGCGSTVEFLVFAEKPDAALAASSSGPAKTAGPTRGTGPEAAREYLDTMQVADGVAVTLFASEPMFVNPADIDVDERGRVWVTEGANYRRWNNPPLRPGGDRIVILEDTNQDGTADVAKTFYQDPTVNAALGIAVFGNRVIVSSGPHVFVLTDTDGDDKADKRELMFTGISGNQHDHGIHAFVFGPDGKLYFNFGNAGEQLKYPIDFKDCPLQGDIPKIKTKPVVDIVGNEVAARGKPYRQGMVFRCNMDGSEVETLGWNFRNNYEVCVDSFGNMWQSDNDDDGNRGVRINYVMEYGNYGFTDEMTGAAWSRGWDKAKAKGVPESEKPAYHWHQSDPGVVPNLLHTGAGSPTGIMFYEGSLLPEAFRNQIIHCDAGPRVTRGYQVENDGAGFRATITNLLTSTDSWYRPSDVCAGPDGAVYVADWNDPGVGGHAMGDNDTATMRGRIYRLAPPAHKPGAPKLKLDTAADCAQALQSPNMATRYLAWTKLREMGSQAESELLKLWRGKDPSQRARAVQLLARAAGDKYIQEAVKDSDANIRIVGLRMARARHRDVIPTIKVLLQDPSPQVRRECAIALRHNPHAESPGVWADLAPHVDAPKLWATLAQQHDGRDRWYLEALGIGAAGHEDLFFNAWLKEVGDKWNTPAGRDIIWRSRSSKAPSYLVKIITDKSTKDPERYLRSLDFIRGPEKEAALLELITAGTQ